MMPSPDTPAGVSLVVETRAATQPISGSFKLAFGSFCDSVAINVADGPGAVAATLSALPNLSAPRRVDIRTSQGKDKITYTITFDPISNPGNQPSLRVTDVSTLNGINAAVAVATTVQGSTDAFYAPIPTELLSLAVGAPSSLSVVVNGVPSACAAASGLCTHTYTAASTPTVSGVTPPALAFAGVSSQSITITGTGFASGSGVEVRVGGVLATVTSSTATSIVASVPDTAPAGVQPVAVTVLGLGLASTQPTITLETLYVTGAQPTTLSLPSNAISIFNLTGKGFDAATCTNNAVTIGSTAASLVACSSGFVTVAFPGNGGSDSTGQSITAQIFAPGNSTAADSDTPASLTANVVAAAPALTGISPATLPSSGGDVELALSNAVFAGVTSVFLVPQVPTLSNFTALAAAYSARKACASISTAAGGVTCSTGIVISGSYQFLVVLSSGLQLLSTNAVSFDLVVTAIFPSAGSIGGGTSVTITGAGFHPTVANNFVFMTVPVSTTYMNGLVPCKATAVNATTLTCVTGAHMAANAEASDPMAKNVLPVATAVSRGTRAMLSGSWWKPVPQLQSRHEAGLGADVLLLSPS